MLKVRVRVKARVEIQNDTFFCVIRYSAPSIPPTVKVRVRVRDSGRGSGRGRGSGTGMVNSIVSVSMVDTPVMLCT